MLAFVGAHDFDTPATRFCVTAVHAEQIAGEQRGFIPACTGADFDKRIALVIGIFRQQQNLKLLLHLFCTGFGFLQLFLRHLAHFRIVEHHLRGFNIFLNLLPVGKAARNIAKLRIFTRQCAKTILVCNSRGIAEQGLNFFVALVQSFQFSDDRGLHRRKMHLVIENGCVALFQPEAVAQNSQAFIIPVTGSLLK
ncbi:hypothetical protein D3C78_637300 [compost metagenome]